MADAPEVLSSDQQAALLAQATGPKNGLRNLCMLDLMLRRGLRVGEVIAIEMRDVQWSEKKVLLRETKAGRKRKDGKRTKGRVYVDIPDRTWELLLQWKRERRMYPGSEKLFVSTQSGRSGRPLSTFYVWSMVRRYSRRAGIDPPIHPHTLRHTAATNLLKQGYSLEHVRRFMRHANIANTQIYLHVEDPELKEMVQNL